MSWQQRIGTALEQRQQQQALRRRQPTTASGPGWIEADGQRLRNFSANDYLGLAQDTRLAAAWHDGALRYGNGAGGSAHVTGYHPLQQRFEARLAEWLGYPRALLFISGFAANQAIVAAMMAKGDRLLADKLAHASILEAAHLSPAELRRFSHNQSTSLDRLLAKPCAGETLVITEGIFSMDGDSAPLAELAVSTHAAGGWMMVDDAHGIGVVGEGGRGSCWQQQVKPELLVITFGKAFGCGGAALLCSEDVADYMLQFARHLIYSTAMPPAQICALDVALSAIKLADSERQRLHDNIQHFRNGAAERGLSLLDSSSAIQPLLVGDNAAALALAQRLRQAGCWVSAIRPPTVPPGSARLRITLSAAHQPADIDYLLEALDASHDR